MGVTTRAVDRIQRDSQRAGAYASHFISEREGPVASLADERVAERYAERNQTNVVITAVVVALVTMIGIAILGEAYVQMPDTGNSTADNTSDSIFVGILDSMSFVPLVVLVLFASLVIGVIQRFR